MLTKVTIELLKNRLKEQKNWVKHQNEMLITSKKRYEKSQEDWKATLKYIEELENDIKIIQKEEAK